MFREGGIYILPNGRQLMAAGDGFNFYGAADNENGVLRYEINEAGRLVHNGRLTAWSVDDLKDSQQTVVVRSIEQRSESTGS